jgi:O-antigen biosynthesis protein
MEQKDWFNNTVICTAVTGGYDYHNDQPTIPGVDYLYFTDGNSPYPIDSPWNEQILGDEHLDNRRRSKRPKLNPHSIPILNEYKYMVWIDGDMWIEDANFVNHIMSFMSNGFVVSPHFDNRHCAYTEATIRPAKYANEPLDEQCDSYRSEGFPEEYGLYECGVSARDLTNPKVKELGELWHQQNLNWSYQDQVSFPYCLWKTGFIPDVLPQSFRDYNWVGINAHKTED